MMRELLLASVLALAACAAPYTNNTVADTVLFGSRGAAHQFPVGDGRTGWEVTCDGARGMADSYQRAAQICHNGFDVIDHSQTGDTEPERSLSFVCKQGQPQGS
jgi:hypothetical protein